MRLVIRTVWPLVMLVLSIVRSEPPVPTDPWKIMLLSESVAVNFAAVPVPVAVVSSGVPARVIVPEAADPKAGSCKVIVAKTESPEVKIFILPYDEPPLTRSSIKSASAVLVAVACVIDIKSPLFDRLCKRANIIN